MREKGVHSVLCVYCVVCVVGSAVCFLCVAHTAVCGVFGWETSVHCTGVLHMWETNAKAIVRTPVCGVKVLMCIQGVLVYSVYLTCMVQGTTVQIAMCGV